MMEMAKYGKHDKTKRGVKEVYDTWLRNLMGGEKSLKENERKEGRENVWHSTHLQ
jgi:hypothetical protein